MRSRREPEKGPPRDPTAWLANLRRSKRRDRSSTFVATCKVVHFARRGCHFGSQRYRSRVGRTASTTVTTGDDILRLLWLVRAHPEIPKFAANRLWRCGLYPAYRWSRSRAASWSAKARWNNASHGQRAELRRRTFHSSSRRAPVGGALRGSSSRRGHDLPYVQRRGTRRVSEGRTRDARATLRRGDPSGASLHCGSSRQSPRAMGADRLAPAAARPNAGASFNSDGAVVLLEDQVCRSLWDQSMISEGLALIDKAMRHRRRDPCPESRRSNRGASLPGRFVSADTDWPQIDLLCAALEEVQPSPVVTLNFRAVAVAKVRGPAAGPAMIEPLARKLSSQATSTSSAIRGCSRRAAACGGFP